MCLQPLFHVDGETVFVTGGEDTTLRIHSIQGFERHRSLSVIRSHISNIRALCRIERERTLPRSTNGSDCSVWFVSAGGRAQMKVWKVNLHNRSETNLIQPDNQCQEEVELTNRDAEKSENDQRKKDLNQINSFTQNSTRCQLSDLSCREVTSHMIRTGSNKTWKSQELTFDPETRYMDATAFWITEELAVIVLASSDGVLR